MLIEEGEILCCPDRKIVHCETRACGSRQDVCAPSGTTPTATLALPRRGGCRGHQIIASIKRGAHLQRVKVNRRSLMIYTIAVVLLILWALGLATSFTAGGLLHALLVIAVVMVIYQLVTGRKVG